MTKPQEVQSGAKEAFTQAYWLLFGNAILIFMLFYMVHRRAPWFSWIDLAYWVTLASVLWARHKDPRNDSSDADPSDVPPISETLHRRLLLAVGGFLWLAVHVAVMLTSPA